MYYCLRVMMNRRTVCTTAESTPAGKNRLTGRRITIYYLRTICSSGLRTHSILGTNNYRDPGMRAHVLPRLVNVRFHRRAYLFPRKIWSAKAMCRRSVAGGSAKRGKCGNQPIIASKKLQKAHLIHCVHFLTQHCMQKVEVVLLVGCSTIV